MAKEAKTASELLALVNAEMSRYDTCKDVKATGVRSIDEDGGFDVSLRASGTPADVATPTVLEILTTLNARYRLAGS